MSLASPQPGVYHLSPAFVTQTPRPISKPRTTRDLNVDYQIRPNLSCYLNVQNAFNVPEILLRYGPETPGYARQYQATTYGAQLTMGIRGTF